MAKGENARSEKKTAPAMSKKDRKKAKAEKKAR